MLTRGWNVAERTVKVELSEREWDLVSVLRDLPASPLRELLHELLHRLVEFVREPGCSEMQADGVPCDRSEADCEECRHVRQMLETLRLGLESRGKV